MRREDIFVQQNKKIYARELASAYRGLLTPLSSRICVILVRRPGCPRLPPSWFSPSASRS
jgi:hypothetical protein